jgi:TolB-like protein/class 3 adenylate cyclase/predicted Zn-dependent protease
MPEFTRQLAVIMFTDIAGYTTLMGDDEQMALNLLKINRRIHKKCIAQYHGKWLKEMGDGVLASFTSVSDAVYCAAALQREAEKEPLLQLSIGIHMGEVIVEVGDVFGDGVNIASRIESSAPAGSIYVSESVNANLTNKKGIRSELVNEGHLKHVKDPVRIYKIDVDPLDPVSIEEVEHSSHIRSEYPGNKRAWGKRKIWISSVLIVAVLVLIYVASSQMIGGKEHAAAASAGKSIVVLPFENLGGAEDEYFADGITDEITSRLGLINGLSMISPVSAKKYKKTTKSMAEIAAELGVDYVLAGSIRWDKSGGSERVRITTNLSNASSNRQLWGDSFVREFKQIFEVQSEIAEKVASALDVTLLAAEKNSISEKSTENLEAYDLYLRGQSYLKQVRSARNYGIAEQLFEKAIRIDPDFALAYSSLSQVNVDFWWFSFDRDSSRITKSKYYLDKAQAINASLPEVQLAAGSYYYHGFLDYENSLKHLLAGLKVKPNDRDLLSYAGYVKRRQGDFNEAINYFQKALKADPLSQELYVSLSETSILVRNYQESFKNAEKANSIMPESDTPYELIARTSYLENGNLKKAIEVLDGSLDVVTDNKNRIRGDLVVYLIHAGEDQHALQVLKDFDKEIVEDPDFYVSKYQLYAELYHFRKEEQLAKTYADSAVVSLQQKLKKVPNDSRIYSSLGMSLALAGQKEEALKAGEKAVELLPVSKDAWRGHLRQIDLAIIYSQVGEPVKAIQKLDYLLSLPGEISLASVKADRNFDSLRNLPAYAALLKKYEN